MNLYRVTVWNDHQYKDRTFEAFVVAINAQHAVEIVEQELWTIGGIEVKGVVKIDTSVSQLLCWNDTNILGLETEDEENIEDEE